MNCFFIEISIGKSLAKIIITEKRQMLAALSFYINFALHLFWLFLKAYSDLNNQG